MIPIGDFYLLSSTVLNKYIDYESVTFGILIADYRQQAAREYIINYMDVFHRRSGNTFDFFLPGYSQYNTYLNDDRVTRSIRVDGHYYHFSESLFIDFCEQINDIFGIEYTFNPMLILVSMKPGYLETVQYIVIELDDDEYGNVRRSGILFNSIFEIVKTDPDIQNISSTLLKSSIKESLIERIINTIDNPLLNEIGKVGNELKRFRINRL